MRRHCISLVVLGWLCVVAIGCQAPRAAHRLRPQLQIDTNLGNIVLELDAEHAPRTVMNYVEYVRDGFYDGTVFHRVIKDGLIQGGAFTPDMKARTAGLRRGIKSEWDNGLISLRGTVAMVRIPNQLDSATSEFFINVSDNPDLVVGGGDGRAYTVFGKVVEGMDVVDRISRVPVGTHPKYAAGRLAVVPISPVIMKRVRMLTPFDPDDAQAVVVRAEMEAERAAEEAELAIQRAWQERFDEIEAKYGEITKTESGLKYVDIRVGQGAYPEPTDIAEILYNVTLFDGTEIESTINGEPKASPLEDAIKGVQEGLLSMREGGKRLLIIPPELAFGETGIPARIPPNATLFFEIELLAVQPR